MGPDPVLDDVGGSTYATIRIFVMAIVKNASY